MMSSNRRTPLKLGFIGGGLNSAVGYTHYLASRMDGLFEVSAGCFSRKPSINEETGNAFGVDSDRIYATKEQLLEQESTRLDAICVLTPTPDHADTVVAALEGGYNVICEKALATSREECDRINTALARSDSFLGVTFNYTGYPMVREARQMILTGDLGKVQQIYCEMPQEGFARRGTNPQDWRKHDYAIPCVSLDLGVHVHHLVDYLTGGAQPKSFSARQANYGLIPDVIDTVMVLADYDNDLLVNMMWGKAALGYRNGLKIRVFGDKGSLEWYQAEPETLIFATEDGQRSMIDRGQPGLIEASKQRYNRFKAGHPAGFVEAFANIYADFFEVMRLAPDQKVPHTNTAVSARQGIEFLETVSHSSP